MRCRKCDSNAVINMRQHKLALCKEHFLSWIPQQTQRFIEKYKMFSMDDRILVAVSGGKDSLALWDILNRLGYKSDGLYIGLGIDEGINYSLNSQKFAEKFAQENNLTLITINVPTEFGVSIPEIANNSRRGKGKPCSVCGLTKRHIMNRTAREGGYSVLVTGHNLDDEASVLLGNTMSWLGSYLQRQAPVLEEVGGLVRKAKPLCRFYEREMTAYALLQEIDYIYDECPFSTGAKTIYYKELLNQLEADRPGAKLIFYLSFLKAKAKGLFSNQDDDISTTLNTCSSCEQLTSAPDLCSFCRMIKNVIEINLE